MKALLKIALVLAILCAMYQIARTVIKLDIDFDNLEA
jgi:hypothetical protein